MDVMTDEFRAGLKNGELLLQKCANCSKLNMYPKFACPFCQSEELDWQPASGGGVLHSYTICRIGAPNGFEQDLPYALGVVKLDEGVQLLARLVADGDGEWGGYVMDERIEFVPHGSTDADARPIAWFRRVSEQ